MAESVRNSIEWIRLPGCSGHTVFAFLKHKIRNLFSISTCVVLNNPIYYECLWMNGADVATGMMEYIFVTITLKLI